MQFMKTMNRNIWSRWEPATAYFISDNQYVVVILKMFCFISENKYNTLVK